VKERYLREKLLRAMLHARLDRLLDLRDGASPDSCLDSSSVTDGRDRKVAHLGKDETARLVVKSAARLFIEVAGWAINHRVGRALLPEDADPNSEAHELRGEEAAQPGGGGWLDEPSKARASLLAAIQWDTLPLHFGIELREALEALEYGEVRALLKPVTGHKHGRPYTLINAKMKAVEYANFQHGKGKTLVRAEEDVSSELCIEQTTLKSWSTRDLPRGLGAEEVKLRIAAARRAGEVLERRRNQSEVPPIAGAASSPDTKLLLIALDWERFCLKDLKRNLDEATRVSR
jgi:hypothetical protein